MKVPSRYLEPTQAPQDVPKTYGDAVKALPDWSAALGQCNADKAAAKKYQEEVNK